MKVKYTVKDFNDQFPDDAACLQYLFDQQNPDGGTCRCGKTGCFHRIAKRKKFACAWCGFQISPTAGTIFHKSRTPLRTWFHAMFIMTASRNGVSAMELMRQVGVTYKTAWRMNHQIRELMTAETPQLEGFIEADETYIGGKTTGGKRGRGAPHKTPILGLLERGGDIKSTVAQDTKASTVMPNINEKVKKGSIVFTDEYRRYASLVFQGYYHDWISHTAGQFAKGMVHTNGLESFWAQFKRSIHGTFHHVSRQHCQKYLNEFCYRNNHRRNLEPMFSQLVSIAGEQRSAAV
jgi:transposase-like protein